MKIKLNRRIMIPAAAAALLLALFTGWWYYHARHIEATRLTLYGNIDIRQIDLAFNGSGRIATMTV
jgi:HlyD family secretion protein